MKRILALMFMASVAIGLWAQDDDYLPFFEDGKVWEYAVYDNKIQKVVHVTDSVCGDIEFQGKNCKIIHRQRLAYSKDFIVYENEKRTYYYDDDLDKFQPLTDFNVRVGDVIDFVDRCGYTISTATAKPIYTISIQGIDRRVLEFDDSTKWLEGIYADSFQITFAFVTRSDLSFNENFFTFGCFEECRKDDRILCTRDDLGLGPMDLGPSNVKDILVEGDSDGPIYDTMGRRVETTRPGQLYIRNGRKVIAKP